MKQKIPTHFSSLCFKSFWQTTSSSITVLSRQKALLIDRSYRRRLPSPLSVSTRRRISQRPPCHHLDAKGGREWGWYTYSWPLGPDHLCRFLSIIFFLSSRLYQSIFQEKFIFFTYYSLNDTYKMATNKGCY